MLRKHILKPLTVVVSLTVLIVAQMSFIEYWRAALDEHLHRVLVGENILRLQRLVADVDSGFRGYVITLNPAFLTSVHTAEDSIKPALRQLVDDLGESPDLQDRATVLVQQLHEYLTVKGRLMEQVSAGDRVHVLSYIVRGEGLAISRATEASFRAFQALTENQFTRMGLDDPDFRWRMLRALSVVWAATVLLSALLGGMIVHLFAEG